MTDKTTSQLLATDVQALLRSRNPLLWIITTEEARVERYLMEASLAAGRVPYAWDVAQGVTDAGGIVQTFGGADPGQMLDTINVRARQGTERNVWILRDLPIWLDGPIGAATMRRVRNLARSLPGLPRESAQAMIVVTPSNDVPPELAGHATVIDWPLPDRAEIEAILDAALESLPDDIREQAEPNGSRGAAIDAAVGLSGEEAAACYAKSLVQLKRIDPAAVAAEKKRVVEREGLLEWFDPLPGGLDAVGGLDNLKTWLMTRSTAYSVEAREYGLPAPKGAMIVGVPGCGKSLSCKATATAWGCPLLKFDPGALKSKFVGESEGNLRKALKVVEAIGRCVVWFDEVEKAMQGATTESADGGVSADTLGTILSWMQERQGESFVMMTANNIAGLPPELLRKGRLDDIWFVDLPNHIERPAVLDAALRAHGRGSVEIDREAVSEACKGFNGAEIAEIVPDALYVAFADGAREITTADLIGAASTVVPMSVSAADRIEKLREWAETRARHATPALETVAQSAARQIDL